MKHLTQYILEGIFDMDKNVSDSHEIEKILFEDLNSDFWKFCIPCLRDGSPVWSLENIDKKIDIDKEIISFNTDVRIDTNYKNPFTNKYSLRCMNFYLGNPQGRGPHPEPVDNGAGFKNIQVGSSVVIDGMCKKIKDFKFIIDNNTFINKHHPVPRAVVNWASNLDYFGADFEFADESNSCVGLGDVHKWPNLDHVTSNAQMISMYDPSLFENDDIKSSLDKFFGKGTVTANGITKTKSIRNIVAIVNNMRKYGALIPTEVIPEGKLSDLINLKGFKNIKKVILRNNNVRITFVKPTDETSIARQVRFIRMNNMNLFKDTPIDELTSMVKQCQTKDGWVVLFEPEQY